MWPFSYIFNFYKKKEAESLVIGLLKVPARSVFISINPETLANQLVSIAWEQKPDIFNGRFGQRPHRISAAAAALSYGLIHFPSDSEEQPAIAIALANLLSDMSLNANLYPFNSMDVSLLSAALDQYILMYNDFIKKNPELPGEVEALERYMEQKKKADNAKSPDPNEIANYSKKKERFITLISEMIVSQQSTNTNDHLKFPDNEFITGYILGFSDAAIQRSIFRKLSDDDAYEVIKEIFIKVYGEDGGTLLSMTVIMSQGNSASQVNLHEQIHEVQSGINHGSQEYVSWAKSDKSTPPFGIRNWLHNKMIEQH